jgi:mono/diheme cytochrome c family protein
MIHRILLATFPMLALAASAQTHDHAGTEAPDSRQHVEFPAPMREHTLASMRDHLMALQEINLALARNDFEKAGSVAEQRLGMSSMEAHGADHLAAFMPKPMQDIGTRMHRAASRFAVEAQDASASNDLKPALAALGAVMQHCVACHAAYRLH